MAYQVLLHKVVQLFDYFLPIDPTKRHAETAFTRPKKDTMSALEPKGSGRGSTSLNRVSASSITQTVKTDHKGNQNMRKRVNHAHNPDSMDADAIKKSSGTKHNRKITIAIVTWRQSLTGRLPDRDSPP